MRPGPRNPGESVADYNTRIKAMEAKWKAGMGGPKSGDTKAAGAGPVRVSPGTGGAGGGKPRGMSPIPPKPPTPVKPTVTTPRPISPRGGGGSSSSGDGRRSDMSPKGDGGSRPRGTSPAPGYSGGKPKVSRTPIRDGRGPSGGGKGGPRGMKSGGMVKGKK